MRNFCFLSSALFLHCFIMVTYAMIVKDLTTDQHSLLEFKAQISDPQNILANNWTDTTDVCAWFGVSCAAKHRRITALNLPSMNLTGTIPPQLGNLSFLVSLNLSGNSFHGHIPEQLGQLSRLKSIDLSFNQFVGPIPPSIFTISSLQLISVEDNKLSGGIPWNIGECISLQFLTLSTNQLSGIIPRSIGNLTNLKEMYLGFNFNIQGEIPREIENLVKLEAFVAQYMGLNGSIPSSIFNMSSLRVIVLYNNSLSGKLPDMGSATNLEVLLLWENYLNGTIPDSIANASRLKTLELNKNSFSGFIPNTLGNLRFLEVLRLWQNKLTTKNSTQGWSFLSSLANCRYLNRFELAMNPLNGILPASISNLSSLEYFTVSNCNLQGSIPMEIGNLSNMVNFQISSNEFSGSIPATIGRLKNLQGLVLDSNKFQGNIPLEICGLKGLNTLWLAANEFDGSLPTCFGNLTSLRYLFLFSNKLHSTIPSTFWSLVDILELDLSSNYLNGSLPLGIGNLKVVTYLNLSRNLLSSDIPLTIESLHDLQQLDLSVNRLQGGISEKLGNLISLDTLDLSRNNLSGVIPKSLEKLSILNYFDVSSNRLEGEIPSGGPFVNFTVKSFMNNSALCGLPRFQVPPCKHSSHNQSKKTIIHVLTFVLPIFASVVTIVALIIVYKKRHNKSRNLAKGDDLDLFDKWRRISYIQLLQATHGFSEHNMLGSGSFGSVYKGILSDGSIVAVKVFNLQMEAAFKSFDIECEVMRNILHRNLVKVITSCSSLDFKALVLEFMPSGSLERWLYSHNCFLDILQRINIMIDVAVALEYLHMGHPTQVIHCDLKPSNVLLDEDMVAHVGDFGIAKLLGEGESIKQTITLATIGYMAPEYGSAGIISSKSDVYSYGILLMEVFTRKKPTDEIFAGEMSMKHWVKSCLSEGIIGVADPNLVHKEDAYFVVKANCISSIMELALNCSAELPEDRIDMKDVVPMLKNIRRKFSDNIEQNRSVP